MSQLAQSSARSLAGGSFQAMFMNSGTFQTISFTGTSGQSSAFQAGTTLIRVVSDVACFIAFGSNPTASSSTLFLPAGIVEYFGVLPGTKVAAIQSTSAGNLYIAEGT